MGEQFYNFKLDSKLQPYCGLDVTQYVEGGAGTVSWMMWDRCVMGLKSSPHGCVKMQSLGEEVVQGNSSLPDNPFYFDKVVLNLPGSMNYDPSGLWSAS